MRKGWDHAGSLRVPRSSPEMEGSLVSPIWLHAKSEKMCLHILSVQKGSPSHLHGQTDRWTLFYGGSLRDQYATQCHSLQPSGQVLFLMGPIAPLSFPLGPRKAFLRSFVHQTFIEHLLSTRPWGYNGERKELLF